MYKPMFDQQIESQGSICIHRTIQLNQYSIRKIVDIIILHSLIHI